MSSVVLALVLAALAAGGPARAEDEWDKRFEQLAEFLGSGQGLEFADNNVQASDFAEVAATHLPSFRKVCAAAETGRAGLLAENAEMAQTFATRLVDVAKICVEKNESSADALWSYGLALLVRGRMERDSKGSKANQADWTDAAQHFEKAWGIAAEDGAPAAQAAQALLEASKLPGADAAALVTAGDALLDRGFAKHPDSGPLLRIWATRVIDKATAAFAVKKADAVPIVDGALKKLAPRVQGKPSPDIDAATAWNDLVAFQADRKLGIKADFVTKTVNACGTLRVKVPISRYFVVDERDASSPITQLSSSFQAVRTFQFDSYSWMTRHDFGVRESPGGDDLKGIASGALGAYLIQLGKDKTFKDVSKARLNGKISGTCTWEATGTRSKGTRPERQRTWCFKSENGYMTTYRVSVYDWNVTDFDAASKSVLDSIDEAPKAK